MNARVRLPLELSGLLRSELEKAIYEAALSREDDFIARRYIIEKVPQFSAVSELSFGIMLMTIKIIRTRTMTTAQNHMFLKKDFLTFTFDVVSSIIFYSFQFCMIDKFTFMIINQKKQV